MTEFEVIESLAFYFDEYKSELKPHWVELIALFGQASVGMIDDSIIKHSVAYSICRNELKELFLNDK